MMRARLCWGIRETLCGGQVRSETRMRDCLYRVGVAIISKFPHLAPLPLPYALTAGFDAERAACRRRPQGRAWGSDLRSGRVRGAVVRARDARASSGSVELLGSATPCPALPTRQPQAAALCLSRKMVWESLRGREGRPHHSPLNVNYAFKTVFIGKRPPPLPPSP